MAKRRFLPTGDGWMTVVSNRRYHLPQRRFNYPRQRTATPTKPYERRLNSKQPHRPWSVNSTHRRSQQQPRSILTLFPSVKDTSPLKTRLLPLKTRLSPFTKAQPNSLFNRIIRPIPTPIPNPQQIPNKSQNNTSKIMTRHQETSRNSNHIPNFHLQGSAPRHQTYQPPASYAQVLNPHHSTNQNQTQMPPWQYYLDHNPWSLPATQAQ